MLYLSGFTHFPGALFPFFPFRKVTLPCLSLCIIFVSSLSGEITFMYFIKERVYWQIGNEPAERVFEWNISAGVSGDSEVTGGTAVYPGGSTVLSGGNGAYGFEPGDYFSLEELNTAFPNGDVSLSITEGGVAQDYGPFSLTGDVYPEVPFVTNTEALQAADFTQDFEVTWDPFEGAVEGDEILFIVENNRAEGNPIFQFIPGSSTSFLIPGGTLLNDGDYSIQVSFIKKTADPPPSVDIKVGYISQIRVPTISPSEDPYAFWALTYNFGGGDSGEDADPDFDGLVNLLEMVLGTNPTQGGDVATLSPTVVMDGGTIYAGVEVIRAPEINGIETRLEMASHPGFSSTVSQVEVGAGEVLTDGRERRVFRAVDPLDASEGFFVRLWVNTGDGN